MNYIQRFKNGQDVSVSVGNNYYEDHLMHILFDNFRQGMKYNAQISSNQVELRIGDIFTDQIYLSVLYLQTDYLIPDSSSGIKNEKENLVQVKFTFCGGYHPTDNFFKENIIQGENLCCR